jgi:pantetheine-phosphate adenylyltransferase
MEAIVVSKETVRGAEAINKGRVNRGFRPLIIVVVPVIGGRESASKLSSTQLRAQDAAAAAAQISKQ